MTTQSSDRAQRPRHHLHHEASGPTGGRTAQRATPIVLVHAGVADSGMWDGAFERLAQRRRTVRYDLRGYGRSPDPEGPFSHHGDLVALLDGLGIERAHLVGCSNGGAVAIDAALARPERVASLTPVSSALGGVDFDGPPPPALAALFGALAEGAWERATELAAQVWLDGPKRGAHDVDAELRARLMRMVPRALATFAPKALQPTPLDPPAVGRLHEIAAPTLVVAGALDDDAILALAERMTQGITDAERVVLPDVAHLLPMEVPERFAELVERFVGRAER